VEEAYAAKMDEWIVWEAGETRRITSFFLLCPGSFLVCMGDPYPEICAQRTLGAEDFLCMDLHAGAAAGFLCPSFVYIPLRCERL
jgi:hypothetical protein